MTAPSRALAPLVRVLGGDPDVFFPVARAHALLVRRRAGLLSTRKVGIFAASAPFRILCLLALVYGAFGADFVLEGKSRLFGAALAVTIGCVFLLMVVVTDYFDVLVNPREQLVLGAHPHDDRSVLLAKLFIVGRTLSILFAFLFLPSTAAIAWVEHSAARTIAYVAGAAGASLATVTFGLYLSVVTLVLFGRSGLERVLPWLQVGFQLSYFLFVGGGKLIRGFSAAGVSPATLWALPSFWFLGPLEALQAGRWSVSIAARSLLALALVVALVVGGTAWLGRRVGERLLEPIQKRPRPSTATQVRERGARAGDGGGLRGIFRSRDGRLFFDLFQLHFRSDWRMRSELFLGPAIYAFYLLTAREQNEWVSLFVLGLFLVTPVDALTRSARPELLWAVLVAPLNRIRFSKAAVSVVRLLELAPLVALFAVAQWRRGGTFPHQAFSLLQSALYGDLLIVMSRGLFPEFPFSRPGRTGASAGDRVALFIQAGVGSAAGTALLWWLSHRGLPGAVAAIAFLLLARLPATWWMRRRVAGSAEDIEPPAASAA